MAMTDTCTYRRFITYDSKGNAMLYVEPTKALYGMMKSALLFYLKLWRDLQKRKFRRNPYDPCVANSMVNGTQMTVIWHVDDLKISHAQHTEVTKMIGYLKRIYGELTISRGKKHEYLGMELDFSDSGKVKFTMNSYVDKVLEEYCGYLGKPASTPASDFLFDVRPDDTRKLLPEVQARLFHRFVV